MSWRGMRKRFIAATAATVTLAAPRLHGGRTNRKGVHEPVHHLQRHHLFRVDLVEEEPVKLVVLVLGQWGKWVGHRWIECGV